MKPKNILILGGSRFIGYVAVSELIKEGHNINIFNRQITKPPSPFPKNTKFIKGNRNNPQHLDYLFNNKYDVVIDTSGYISNHVEPIVKKYSSNIGQYIFISTSALYKKKDVGQINEQSPKYKTDKGIVEDILLNNKKGLHTTIFRPQGVFGPYDPCLGGLIFYRILNNLPILIHDDSTARVNHIFIYDLINAISLSIGNNKTFGKIYNVACDDHPSLIEYIKLCGEVCSITPIIKHKKMNLDDKNLNFIKQKRHVNLYADWPNYNKILNNQLIKDELQISFTKLKESLDKTYLWLKQNKKSLNYFSIRGESFILLNRPIPLYKKIVWHMIDFWNKIMKEIKQILKRINLIKKIYYNFKNLLSTQTK